VPVQSRPRAFPERARSLSAIAARRERRRRKPSPGCQFNPVHEHFRRGRDWNHSGPLRVIESSPVFFSAPFLSTRETEPLNVPASNEPFTRNSFGRLTSKTPSYLPSDCFLSTPLYL